MLLDLGFSNQVPLCMCSPFQSQRLQNILQGEKKVVRMEAAGQLHWSQVQEMRAVCVAQVFICTGHAVCSVQCAVFSVQCLVCSVQFAVLQFSSFQFS